MISPTLAVYFEAWLRRELHNGGYDLVVTRMREEELERRLRHAAEVEAGEERWTLTDEARAARREASS